MRARWGVVALAVALSLAACGGSDDEESSTPGPNTGPESEAITEATVEDEDGYEDRGTITLGDRVFTFNPTTCWVAEDDSEVNGPGREEGGDVVYVDFSGEGGGEGGIRIELGTDQPFDTTDDQITADRYVTEPLSVTIDGLDVTATGVFLDENDQEIDGEVSFSCE